MGVVDVDALLDSIPSRLLTEWMAYYAIEPFGEERADLRSAIVASLLANAHRHPDKRREPFTPADFMPRFDEDAEAAQQAGQANWQRQKAIMQLLTQRDR